MKHFVFSPENEHEKQCKTSWTQFQKLPLGLKSPHDAPLKCVKWDDEKIKTPLGRSQNVILRLAVLGSRAMKCGFDYIHNSHN